MSTLLEQASLVMIPSGYKEDVVYSQIPTNGNGDLSFTRASNGTRVNSAGLVEVCPWNLAQYSEDFSNAVWSKNNATITANATTAPNGTTTADLIDDSSSSFGDISQTISSLENNTYTFSAYIKAVSTATNVRLDLYTGVGEQFFAVFNSLTGAYVSGNGGVYTSTALSDGWFRLTLSATGSGNTTLRIYPSAASSSATGSVYAWGAQLNIGSTAKPYFPTTDRLNVPRLTYQNGGGGCPSLLLEKQSTNEALESNTLTTNPNVVDFSTTTANVYVSPDGTQNAMRFTETTNNNRHGFYQYTTVTAQTYTASIFTKQTGRRYISFDSDITGTSATSFFDLQTISVVSSGSGHTCSIQDFGNGWLRLIVTFTASAGARYVIWGGSPNGTTNSYAGSTSISQTFYGYQLEASSYPTSYIPTTSASATRVADACSKTGISSLIGQTEGVLFCDFEFVGYGSVAQWIAFLIGAAGDYIGFYTNSSNKIVMEVSSGGPVFLDVSITLNVGTRYKMAVAYKANDFAFYVNGSQISIDASGSVPSCSEFNFNYNTTAANIATNKYNQAALFKTRLTNSELASLTTI
jgi:hypothetical protein